MKNVKEAVNEAFVEMRKQGLLARQNFECCSSCAGYALTTLAVERVTKGAKIEGCCYYHRQDAERFENGGDLMLQYGQIESQEVGAIGRSTLEVGVMVCDILKKVGLLFKWNGKEESCIEVLCNASEKALAEAEYAEGIAAMEAAEAAKMVGAGI